MRSISSAFWFVFISAICATGCKDTPSDIKVDEELIPIQTLKSAFEEDFLIGTTLNASQIKGENKIASGLIKKEFNSISPENIMKWMHIHPGVDSFNFTLPDKFVELGQSNDMFVLGHTLVWHSQLAPWVREIKASKEMEHALEKHINRIATRYRGKVDGWDVINEALNEDGTLRESIFLKTLGEDYIHKVFGLAAKADPDAELYYNDYNLCQPAKRDGCIKLIKSLQEAGVKIDGVGIQGHWKLDGPSIDVIEEAILAYADLGIKVMITELDITVLPNPWDLKGAEVNQNYEGSPYMNPYPGGLPDSIQLKLADRYQDIFELFLKHRDKIDRVTFWGLSDGQSWLNNWPIKKRTNYPLLFDRNYKPKKAHQSVMELKSKKRKA